MLPGKCLHQIFELRAREAPERIAVSAQAEELTYGELNVRADRLAQRLLSLGVGPDVLVGLCIDRSTEMIVGLLGILKAGGAYVPVDPTYPARRVEFLLGDSGVDVVVTSARVAECLESCRATVVHVDEEATSGEVTGAASATAGEMNLAYVIYTSGSTGRPKGVAVEHRNVVRLFEQTEHWFSFDERDVWTMFHSISFDFSVWEIWGALLYGGRLVIVPDETRLSPEQFRSMLLAERVTVLNQTPSAFRQLVAAEASRATKSDFALRLVIFGGEALDLKTLGRWVERFGDQRPALVNMYGITETTVHVTYRRVLKDDLRRHDLSPVGVPLPDLEVYLLDESGQPVSDGTPGNIYVGGAGLARGYLHRPKLTAQLFAPGLPAGQRGARLYDTGDRAVRLPGGELAYLGRRDDQMKVRGYRIEPREVEACLCGHTQVSAAFVTAHDYGENDVRLMAYVAPQPGLALDGPPAWFLTAELAERAAAELPAHMRPSDYFVVAALPLTPHGKVDRDALRRLASERPDYDGDANANATPTEKVILGIWEEVLQRRGIGLEDDFFDLGGTSLALIRILASVNRHFNVSLNAGVLADEASVARLARCVNEVLPPLSHSLEHGHAGTTSARSILS